RLHLVCRRGSIHTTSRCCTGQFEIARCQEGCCRPQQPFQEAREPRLGGGRDVGHGPSFALTWAVSAHRVDASACAPPASRPGPRDGHREVVVDGIWAFLAVTVVLSISPGPDDVLVLRSALAGGARLGMVTVAGAAAGS